MGQRQAPPPVERRCAVDAKDAVAAEDIEIAFLFHEAPIRTAAKQEPDIGIFELIEATERRLDLVPGRVGNLVGSPLILPGVAGEFECRQRYSHTGSIRAGDRSEERRVGKELR